MSIEPVLLSTAKGCYATAFLEALEKYVMQQLKLGLPRVTHDYRNDSFFKLIFAGRRIIRAPTVVGEL